MEGDFTRNSDDPEASYSGVLMQQGRVQLDADWNEQTAIQTRSLRGALRDLIGAHGGPKDDFGFKIFREDENTQQLTIQTGIYYVDGIRCVQRSEEPLSIDGKSDDTDAYLVFLDVWERHVNAIEDPRLRELALLGPDTATRAEVLWRIRLLAFDNSQPTSEVPADWADEVVSRYLRARPRRRLAARALTVNTNTDPCQLSPLSQYRGRENQLYRVQIHDGWAIDGGKVEGGTIENRKPRRTIKTGRTAGTSPKLVESKDLGDNSPAEPVLFTFKWSRDNGAVVFPILRIAGADSPAQPNDQEIEVTVQVGHLGRDDRSSLSAGDIVEFVHDGVTREMAETFDDTTLSAGDPDPGRAGMLGRVLAPIDRDDLTVRIAVYAPDIGQIPDESLHPYLRRWDHGASNRHLVRGAIPVRALDLDKWLPLEDGVEILFDSKTVNNKPPEQRAGDYWQIPARVASGDVLWPIKDDMRVRMPPHGPHHHYAPLAIVTLDNDAIGTVTPVRRQFAPLAFPE